MKPEHMSNSQLASWLHCGKSYELKRIHGLKGQPSVWLAAGVALHDTLFEINQESAGLIDHLDVRESFERNYSTMTDKMVQESGIEVGQWRAAGRVSKDKPNKEDWHWWRGEGVRQAMIYRDWLRSSGWSVLTHDGVLLAEFETTAEFGGMPVKGFLDSVMVSPDGEMFVNDYKSGTRIPGSKFQLGLYRAALKRTLDLDVDLGMYFMTRKAEATEPFDLRRFTPEYFDKIFSMAKVAMDNDVFIPNPGDACRMCDVSDHCYAVGGALAWQSDPDHPQYQVNNQEG